MKTANVARRLATLTSNLVSPLPENEAQLDTVRRIIGYNLRNNRQMISTPKLQQPAELEFDVSKEKVQEFGKYAVSNLLDEDKFVVRNIEGKDVVPAIGVQWTDIRLPINPIETLDELRWNQKRGEQLGPFISDEGRSFWFDL